MNFKRHVGWRHQPVQVVMILLNKSEAETLRQLLNGEQLWSWPNGKIQLGQSFPDLAMINRLVREGLLDQSYQLTDAGRSALQSWLAGAGLSPSAVPASDAAAGLLR